MINDMSPPPVIEYRYDASPFSVKIDHVLVLKNVPHQKVTVSHMLPRPEITDLLGITYRRIPILAIGNDVYCDTSLIASALERRFPPSAGYGTIFPLAKHGGSQDTGLVKVFAKLYDTTLFPVTSVFFPFERLPAAFVKDRSALTGAPIDVKHVVGSREKSLTTLSAHLSLLEEQFRDGREWLFDSELPSLADISVHFTLIAARASPMGRPLVSTDNFSLTVQWLERVSNYIERKRGSQATPQIITGDQAAASILSSTHESYEVVGFDAQAAARLGFKLYDRVQIAPDDTGRNYPTVGKLVGMNREEVVIEVQAPKGLLRCHFPQIGFTVKAVRSGKL
ncbi:hypothetical protein FPV67DRAFT_1471382 [Lyophyllum atratum]|nr:hypothetical protein FPV67DRAFT_1471382 [Lyophyllum atratum]